MNSFRITFRYKVDGTNTIESKTVDIGFIQDIGTKISPKSISSGIPSQPSQNAFAFDYGVIRTYEMSYLRVNPSNPNDGFQYESTEWSNGFWLYVMKHYVANRWQTETDGCKIIYLSDEEGLYPSIPLTNVYVDSFKSSQKAGNVDSLFGTIKFTVGGVNISKDVAKHVITYDSDYPEQTENSDAQSDTSNLLTVTNRDFTNVIEVPSTWMTHAKSYGIYQPSDDLTVMKTYFRWNTEADGSGTSYRENALLEFGDESELTLYARYNRTDPDA